ncbi:MAG: leucyl/phenylalanyl-tRNA--protein transferase [Verrucomicrobiota bacterium]
MTILLPDHLQFPDVRRSSREGLLAVGGDLSLPRLLLAYRSGIFPWTDDPLTWWSPNPRAIFDLQHTQPPRRLAQKIRQSKFKITFDLEFDQVIRQCARPARGRESTWISPRFIHAYSALHAAGHAHSVEAWADGRLVGGLYGVHMGGFFAGESMFHHQTDASKVCLFALFDRLRDRGVALFDTQVLSPLTERLGAIEITRDEYLERLREALRIPATW